MHQNILKFKRGRYFFISILLLLACFAIYFTQGETQPANGGTWQGYVLGTLAALLIVWLTALGVRKRRYSSSLGSMQGWASAHVYLGGALLVIATLHCAVQFGWNVHTLAYALMILVIFSGFYGLYVYLRYPGVGASNRSNRSRAELFTELGGLNESVRGIIRSCDAEVQRVVDSAVDRTQIGGGVLSQLLIIDHSQMLQGGEAASKPVSNKDQAAVIDFVAERIPRGLKKDQSANLQQLLSMLCRRQTLLRKIRKDIRLQGWLKAWLYVHVPLTIALLFALSIHIVSVFIYW